MRLGLLAILLTSASLALATPSADLERGRQSFRARDYSSAIPVLNSLLYPEAQLARTNDLVEAHLLLGGAHFESGNPRRAREEFERALQLQPDRSISTLQYSEGAVKLFDDVKTEVLARARQEAELKRIADAQAAIQAYKDSLRVYEVKPFGFNFLPFGFAQYSQDRTTPQVLFAIGHAATLVPSVGIYIYLVRTYGFTNNNVPLADGPRVRRLQQIEIGTGIAFLGLYAWSVYDAIRHHKPRVRVEGDDSVLPPELREKPPVQPAPAPKRRTLKKVTLLERMRFTPMVTDESVGIGIGWEN